MLSRQGNHAKAAFLQGRVQMPYFFARGAEQDRGGRIVEAQQIDHGILDFRGRDRHCLIGNIAVTSVAPGGGDA